MDIKRKPGAVSISAGVIALTTLACAGCCAPLVAPILATLLFPVLAWTGIAGLSAYSEAPTMMVVAVAGISVFALLLVRRYLKRRTSVSCKGFNCSAEACKGR
jgi:membrane protein implicated in regulation of membrane protease activity